MAEEAPDASTPVLGVAAQGAVQTSTTPGLSLMTPALSLTKAIVDPSAVVVDEATAQLPSVTHDYPAAVLLVDTDAGRVVFINDLARQLAPDVALPISVEDWSRAAGLQVASGSALADSSHPLTHIATGDTGSGQQINAALRSEATDAREALWAIGMPLHGALEPLRARSLLVLLPLRYPDAVAGVQAAAATRHAHEAVLTSGLAMSISDAAAGDDGEPDPLVWVSPSFEQLTGYPSDEVLGRNCRFLQGPGTDATALARIRAAMASNESVSVTLLNYRRNGSAFYNHLVISPVFNAEGTLTHHVSVQTDATGQVLATREQDRVRTEVEGAHRAQATAEGERRVGRLLLTMIEALTTTTTVEQIATTITEVVAAELGAAGGGLLLADAARTRLEFVTLDDMPSETDNRWAHIDWNADAPLALAARTGRASFHPDTAGMLAAHPTLAAQAEVPVMGASASLPLVAGREVLGAVFLYWDQPHVVLQNRQEVLSALARYTAQAVQRATLIADRRTTAQVLQESLLTRLPEPDHLELRARYVPAAVGEHVGGDWYDAVVLPDGGTVVVIGDVTGHDISAAANMGQLRGLLRAYAYDRQDPPADIVARLDRAVEGLHVDTLATLILAKIEQTPQDRAAGVRRLRWTNAGHPPPILLLADGTTEVLEEVPELLVGLVPDTDRTDHTHVLPPGSTLLLYSDGLIEHRGRSLDDGIADLRRALTVHADHTLSDLLDHLVTELVGESPDDDCAILAVRAHPEDKPRPPEAGPNRIT